MNVKKKIDNKDLANSQQNKTWMPLLRQVLVSSCIWSCYVTIGLSMGSPTVIIPQLRREANSTDAVSPETASWMSSIHGFASLPWFFLPLAAGKFGRKYPFLFTSVVDLVSFIVLLFSTTTTHILIAETLHSSALTCCVSVSIIIVAEYSSPKYRGPFLALKSASLFWGIWIANALGTFYHWKTIAGAGIVCSLYNIIATLIWCESPSWLALKHRYEDSIRAQKWIKGDSPESVKEIEDLIKTCKENQEYQNSQQKISIVKRIRKTAADKAFYKPILLTMAMQSLYHASGKMICAIYAIDILKKITASESTAYMGMLLLDGVTVAGMYIGCVLASYIKRRTLLFTGSLGGIFFLFTLSLYLFLVRSKLFDENNFVSLTLLTCFFLFISIGPVILAVAIYGEIIPLRYRTHGMFLTGMFSLIMMSVSLKTAPLVFRTFDMHGGFLFYGIISLIFTSLLYKYMPETKGKTLQEIENICVGKRKELEPRELEPIVKNK